MKPILTFLFLSFLLAACVGASGDNTTGAKDESFAHDPVYQQGLKLVAENRCFQCHHIENRVNGPAYREVADKYAGADNSVVANLAQKIITGGKGVWGEISMIPHPQVSKADAEAMVRYILLLKH